MAGSAPTIELTPGAVVSGYTLVRPIGGGQMGEVHEATAPDGRRVAIKVLKPQALLDTGAHTRFAREARVCMELRSPHIVPVLDHGLHRGRPLLVMPLLTGLDLETWLEKAGPLRPDVAVTIALQVCDALAVAHARNVVHRDLKPANIFLNEQAGALTAVVCDFGVAKIVDEDGTLTASGAVLGTPLYMSPEQMLDSKRVDKRCDVWALGMTLYHMLSGKTAHDDVSTIAELVLALSSGIVKPVQSIAPWITPALARVVHAALLSREKRFPDIEQLATALVTWGPPVVPLSTSSMVRADEGLRNSVAPVATLPGDHRDLGTPNDATVGDASSPDASRGSSRDPLEGKTLGGKYRLVRRLGAGGMGAVYEGVDPAGQRTAVKVMLGDSGKDEDAARRFLREMKAVRSIDSPHVVRPIDYGVDEREKIPFFVMELLSGRDLASLLGAIGSLAPEVAVELFIQATEALSSAHAMGIVHRDIKPSNLFLHEPGGGAVVLKVCDFGIAKKLDADSLDGSTELTRTGGLLGSPIYMSPEHAKNAKNVDARSDVWSLGLSLHEALSGIRPWHGCTSVGEVIVAICTEPVPSLSTIAPWVEPGLIAAIERCLERDAAKRWQSVGELGAALSPFRLGRTVSLDDLRPPEGAARTSARAVSVRPPGIVTSGSLAAAARPALDASVALPIERSSPWKWAAVAGVATVFLGGALAYRALTSPGAGDHSSGVASGSAGPPASVESLPAASRSAASAPSSGESTSDSSAHALLPVPTGASSTRAAPPPKSRVAGPAAPATDPAAGRVTATQTPSPQPPSAATPAPPASPARPAASRNDGRVNSRKDD